MLRSIDPASLCMGCMCVIGENEGPVCPHCGFDNEAGENGFRQLPIGAVLKEKYIIGCALGQGGFGITYIGWDTVLDIKIAIKEYYPDHCVSREADGAVTPFTGPCEEAFAQGREKFLYEAKTLAKFSGQACTVNVKDFFLERGTAYIVMEYANGHTLRDAMEKRGGKIPALEALALLRPVFPSLTQVHSSGLLHRDISPDNIIVQTDGSIKLLDFGAARQMSLVGERSNTVNVKHGYAPEEQYRTRGEQGPWTDVYALCATIYKITTGVTPAQSLERIMEESPLTPPNELGADFSPRQEQAILRGMSVRAKNRQQSITELYNELYDEAAATYSPMMNLGPEKYAPPNGSESAPTKIRSKRNAKFPWDLPERICTQYTVVSCVKDTADLQSYLLKSKTEEGRFYFLKRANENLRLDIEREYGLYGQGLGFLPEAVEFFEEETFCYLLREYIEGYSLQDKITADGTLKPKEAAKLTLVVCDMISALHELDPQMIHGRLSARHVIITRDGQYRLIGLGGAQAEGSITQAPAHAQELAPERLNFGRIDRRTDVFGLGMLLLYLTSGNLRHDNSALVSIDLRLRKIIRTCLSFHQQDRYSDVLTLKKQLTKYNKGNGRFVGWAATAACLCVALIFALQPIEDRPAQGSVPTPGQSAKILPTPTPEPDYEVTLIEPLIEAAIRHELNVEDDVPLMASQLRTVNQLLLCGTDILDEYNDHSTHDTEHFYHDHEYGTGVQLPMLQGGISSLEDITQLPNLQYVILDNQSITDISPIRGLKLNGLSICNNPIEDFSVLQHMTSLESLQLSYAGIEDLSVLIALETLHSLNISGNSIQSLEPLEQLQRLETLCISKTVCEDYSPITRMHLAELELNNPPKEVLELLGEMTTLKMLNINDCRYLTEFSQLHTLKSLWGLNVGGSSINKLEGIDSFPMLQELWIYNTKITDISLLKSAPKLEKINIYGLRIKDYSIITELKLLHTIECSNSQKSAIMRELPDLDVKFYT